MLITPHLDHFALAAADTDAMVAWYGKVLGLVVHAQTNPTPPQTQKAYLIGPPITHGHSGIRHGSMIEVMPCNNTSRHHRSNTDPGLSHIAFYVPDFDAALDHLKSCNVKFLGDVVEALGGGRLVSFADCEANMIQIVERK